MTDCILKIPAIEFWKGGNRRDHFNPSFSILLWNTWTITEGKRQSMTVRPRNWNMEWVWNYTFKMKWVLTDRKERHCS